MAGELFFGELSTFDKNIALRGVPVEAIPFLRFKFDFYLVLILTFHTFWYNKSQNQLPFYTMN